MKNKIKTFFLKLYDIAFEEDVFSSAAQVAFYFSFSLFPLMLFLISLSGIVLSSADELRNELFYYLSQIMPVTAFKLVKDTIKEITENSTGGKLTIGLLIALWSAAAGVDSLRIALNSVYNLKEKRAWWKTKLLSLFMIIALTFMISITLGIIFYGWKFIFFLLSLINLPIPSVYFLIIIQWLMVISLLLAVFALIYNFLPCNSPFRWVWITPGAITSIILWLIVSFGFRTYLQYYNTYDRMYGSLGAVIILMLWLYLTALVILLGGIINTILREMSGKEIIKGKNDYERIAEEITISDKKVE